MAGMYVWTTREVSFELFPTEVVDVDAVIEALCEQFYDRPLVRRLVGAVISGDERGLEVTGRTPLVDSGRDGKAHGDSDPRPPRGRRRRAGRLGTC